MATSASSVDYYGHDPLGSIRDVTDANGTPVAGYDYEPYGSIRTQTGTLDQPLRFTGQYLDPSGLYHLRARQYDSPSGRFLSADPARQTLDGGALTAYAYAGNRPTTMVDPTGETFYPSSLGIVYAEFASGPTHTTLRPSTSQPQNELSLPTFARNAFRLPVPRPFPQRDPRDNCHVLSTTIIGDKIVTRLLCFRPDGTTYVVEEVTFIEDFPPPKWKPVWPPRPILLPPPKKGTIIGVRPGPGGVLIPGLPTGGW